MFVAVVSFSGIRVKSSTVKDFKWRVMTDPRFFNLLFRSAQMNFVV
jgi:hypothetical protein